MASQTISSSTHNQLGHQHRRPSAPQTIISAAIRTSGHEQLNPQSAGAIITADHQHRTSTEPPHPATETT